MTKVETINKLLRSVIGVGLNLTTLQSKWESLEIALEYHEVMVKEQLDRMKVNNKYQNKLNNNCFSLV